MVCLRKIYSRPYQGNAGLVYMGALLAALGVPVPLRASVRSLGSALSDCVEVTFCCTAFTFFFFFLVSLQSPRPCVVPASIVREYLSSFLAFSHTLFFFFFFSSSLPRSTIKLIVPAPQTFQAPFYSPSIPHSPFLIPHSLNLFYYPAPEPLDLQLY